LLQKLFPLLDVEVGDILGFSAIKYIHVRAVEPEPDSRVGYRGVDFYAPYPWKLLAVPSMLSMNSLISILVALTVFPTLPIRPALPPHGIIHFMFV